MTNPNTAPMAANGKENRMAIGALIDLKVKTMIKKTMPIEINIVRNKSEKSSGC